MTVSGRARLFDRHTPPHVSTLTILAGLSALAMNVFLPSLPGMATHFETDYAVMQLSVAVYLAMSGLLQLFIGPISDKFGRRPVILWGLILFILATLGCLTAQSAEVFLFFRICQAAIGVGMVLSRAAVRDMYPQDQAASMIGYVTMGMAVVPMVGPIVGGFLDEALGWEANFWMLIALGLATLALVWSDLGETAPATTRTLVEQFREYPALLLSPRFWGYSLASGFSSGAFFSYLGGAPFVGSVLFALSPSQLGLVFGAPAIGYFLGNFLTGRYAQRVGLNRMIFWGCICNLLGTCVPLALFWFGLGSAGVFFGSMTLVGLGNGLSMPNAMAGMLSVRPHLAGTASGLGGAIMLAGGASLSALAGNVLSVETGAFPLLYMMALTSVAAMLSLGYVLLRERQLGISSL